MSSMIDRRFLDISMSVLGVVNEPPATPEPVNGTQWIVGDDPKGVFASATAGSLARYDGYSKAWKFIKPAIGQMELLNVATGEFIAWDGTDWAVNASLDDGTFEPPVERVLPTSRDSAVSIDSPVYFDPATAKLYTYSQVTSEWDGGVVQADGTRWASVTDGKIYVVKDGKAVGHAVKEGMMFLSKHGPYIVIYQGTGHPGYFNVKKDIALEPVYHVWQTGPLADRPTTGLQEGDMWLDTEAWKAYTVNASGEWQAWGGVLPHGRIASINEKKIYDYDGTSLYIYPLEDGAIFLDRDSGRHYIYKYGNVEVLTTGPDTVHEKRALTAAEATAKGISLRKSVMPGAEGDVMLFVCGVPQVADVDFAVSGSTLSWADKRLKDIDLSAGDMFIIIYQTLDRF